MFIQYPEYWTKITIFGAMDQDYLDILREWERQVGRPALFENLDGLFPEFRFRRVNRGGGVRDHWASSLKKDGTQPKRRHAEKTVVYAMDMRFREQGEWEEGEDVVQKLMQKWNCSSVYEVFSRLDEEFSLCMPRPDSEEAKERKYRKDRKKELLRSLEEYFAGELWNMGSRNAGRVRHYLTVVRGFHKESCRSLGFGFVPPWDVVIRHFATKLGYSYEELDDACGVRNGDGYSSVGLKYTLAIPYKSAGETKGFIFRRVGDGDGPKYLATRGLDRKSAFFNMPAVVPEGEIVVVEGELDSLKLTSVGIRNVVSIGGSEIAGERRGQVVDAFRRGVKKITLCLDLDGLKDGSGPDYGAYHAHVMKCIHTIKDVDLSFEELYVASLPEVSDPDEYVRKHGAEAFRGLLSSAPAYWEYLYQKGRERRKPQGDSDE